MSLDIDLSLLTPLVPSQSEHPARLWVHKTTNLFRGVIELRASANDANHLRGQVRQLVKTEFAPGFFIPFAFGTILRFAANPPGVDDLRSCVDTKNDPAGTWQWIIIVDEETMLANGIHTWTSGYLTPVYHQLIRQLEQEGYDCRTETLAPDKIFTRLWSINKILLKLQNKLLWIAAVLALLMVIGKLIMKW